MAQGNGDRNSGVRSGLWEYKHCERMGTAVFLFGWLVDRQTKQEAGLGWVLHGRPLLYSYIAAESGYPVRVLKDWMCRLKREGYIRLERVMQGTFCLGSRIFILNAKKFAPRQGGLFEEGTQNRPMRDVKSDFRGTQNRPNGETENRPINSKNYKARHKSVEPKVKSAAAPHPPMWVPLPAWAAYKEMRQRIRKPMTRRAEEMAISKLDKLRASGQDPGAVLEQSVFNSWQGLFAVKPEGLVSHDREQRHREKIAAGDAAGEEFLRRVEGLDAARRTHVSDAARTDS